MAAGGLGAGDLGFGRSFLGEVYMGFWDMGFRERTLSIGDVRYQRDGCNSYSYLSAMLLRILLKFQRGLAFQFWIM